MLLQGVSSFTKPPVSPESIISGGWCPTAIVDSVGVGAGDEGVAGTVAATRCTWKQRTRDPNYIAQEILKIIEVKPSRTMELANILLLTNQGLTPHLNRMLEEGLIVKRGYKNKVIWDVA